MTHSSIQAAIFDLDGTLADTIGDLGGAVNSVLKAHGFPQHSLPSLKKMVGNGFSMLMKRALPDEAVINETLFRSLSEEAASAYSRMALDTTKPYPGIVELLRMLCERKIVCAVLSNKPDPMTKTMISSLFPDMPFIAVIGDKPDAPRKPDPSGALAIAALSGIHPSGWAFVGDSGVDMRTGVAAGMLPLGASWGFRGTEELRENGAVGILGEPGDLLRYL
ncbi:MAG TPA: HAD family hydrolase [Rectinemataceae bacterium]|nr:HAD family hydrolase [Rectinemataceae bacterium]